MSRANSLMPSTATSGVVSPSVERKHIHFDEQVKQCIAVEAKGDDEEEEEEADPDQWKYEEDSDSDDGAIMMKRTASKKKPVKLRNRSKTTGASESKTIAMLPSTTLKYREDTPEPRETAMKHSTGAMRSPIISPSSSQETLRPSRKSGKFFDDDEDEDEIDPYADIERSTTPISSPVGNFAQSRQSGLQRSASSSSLTGEPAGMRRTESGMFMPEDDAQGNEGIFGRVIDTVNTARDIAHVIWNVGWRR